VTHTAVLRGWEAESTLRRLKRISQVSRFYKSLTLVNIASD
jgi:hypothetical protein